MLGKKIKIISVLAVIALMACSLVPVVNNGTASTDSVQSMAEEEKEPFKYVSLGDSMTAGFGLTDYQSEGQRGFLEPVAKAYPNLIAEYLQSELGESYDVEHIALALSGSRTIDLRALLDETFIGSDGNPGDGYTDYAMSEYQTLIAGAKLIYTDFADKDGIDFLRAVYQKELAEADLITYHQHIDYIWAYILDQYGCDYDFTLYFDPDFADDAEKIGAMVEGAIISYLKTEGIDISAFTELIEKLIKGTIYSVLSYCVNFDAFMKFLSENNPEAKVIVIDTYPLLEDLDMKIGDVSVSIDGIYSTLIDIGNYYIQYCSPYSQYAYQVSTDEHPNTFGDEFRYLDVETGAATELKNELSVEARANAVATLFAGTDYADYYPIASEASLNAYNGYDFDGHFTKFMNYVFTVTEFDVSALFEDASEIATKIINMNIMADTAKNYGLEFTVEYDEEEGTFTASVNNDPAYTIVFTSAERTMLFLSMEVQSAIMLHAGQFGNETIASCVENAIEEQDILADDEMYIVTDESASAVALSQMDLADLTTFVGMALLRGTINYTIINWDEISALIESYAYEKFYEAVLDLFYEWYEWYTNLEGNLDAIYQKLVELDDSWLEIFGIFSLTSTVKMLHSILEEIIDEWDSIKDTILEYAGLFNEYFKQILDDLDPYKIIIVG